MAFIFRSLRTLAWLFPAGMALVMALAMSLLVLGLGTIFYFSERFEMGKVTSVSQTNDPEWREVDLDLLDIKRKVFIRAGSAGFGRDVSPGQWLLAYGTVQSPSESHGNTLMADRVSAVSALLPDFSLAIAQIAQAMTAAVLVGVIILLLGAIFQHYLSAAFLAGVGALTAWLALFLASVTGHIAQPMLVGLPIVGLAAFFGLVMGVKLGPLNALSMALARFTTALLVAVLTPTVSTLTGIGPGWVLGVGVVIALIMPPAVFVVMGTWLMAQGLGLSLVGQIILMVFNTAVVVSIMCLALSGEHPRDSSRKHVRLISERRQDGSIPLERIFKGGFA